MKKISLLALFAALLVLPSCASKEGTTPVTPTPEPEPTPTPTVTYSHKYAFWEISSTYASSSESDWTSQNKFYANGGDGAEKAFVSTSGDGVVRLKNGSNISATNMMEGCSINFMWPDVTIAAGSIVDFMGCLYSPATMAPKYWIFEYYDGGAWKSVEEDLRTASEDASLKYSLYLYKNTDQYSTFAQSFTLENAISKGTLQMRLRAVGKYNTGGGTLTASSGGYVGFVNMNWRGASIDIYQGITKKDTKKVLELGNSFSYYYGTAFVLKELAMSQGHAIRLRAFNKGSQTFSDHSGLELSKAQVSDGGFDYAVLQDQSTQHAAYASNPTGNASVLSDTKTLFATIKSKSPSVSIILENTWAYAGSSTTYGGYTSMENFDRLLQSGATSICKTTGATMSPIGIAFQKARSEGITDLYHTDSKHPNRNGVYLKACVNYLTIYKEKFDANVPDLLVNSATAKKLRTIAEDVVLGGWTPSSFTLGTPTATSFDVDGGEGSVSVTSNVDFKASCEASWVSVTVAKDKISWSVAANAGTESRKATIVVEPTGFSKREISLFQLGNSTKSGISTAEELLDFAAKVNAGEDYSAYLNAQGEVALSADIDLTGKTWTPIGLPKTKLTVLYNALTPPEENPFRGVFNGNDHTIKGLSMSVDIQSTQFYGLFATCNGATIKNLKIEGASLVISGAGISSGNADVALLVGYCYGGKVSCVTVNGSVSGSAYSIQDRQVGVGGICGMIGNGTVVENSSFSGSLTASIEEKYTNNNTVNMGGICAATLYKLGTRNCKITDCTNDATVNVQSHRAGGIVASMFYTDIEGCTNNGDVTCVYAPGAISSRGTAITGVRIGGIMGYNSQKTAASSVVNCHNYGTVSTTEAGSVTGGTIGLIKCMTVSGCSNAGNVIGPESAGRGLLIGIMQATTDLTTISSCRLKGKIGTTAETLVDATKENYLNNGVGTTIVDGVSCPTWCSDNVTFWE